jgi:hypothetical protein
MGYKDTELFCEQCGYQQVMVSGKLKTTIYKHGNRGDRGETGNGVIYDLALKSTSCVKCSNKECQSLDVNQWGNYTNDGMLIQPSMVITNYHDKANRINTYVCRVCGVGGTANVANGQV